jgi:membrane protease YdiL (CAAX protease family)
MVPWSNNGNMNGLIIYTILSYMLAYTLDFTIIIPQLSTLQELDINPEFFLEIAALIARMWVPALSVIVSLKLTRQSNSLDLLKSVFSEEVSYRRLIRISGVILAGYVVAVAVSVGLVGVVGSCGYYRYLNPIVILGEIILGIILGVTVNSAVALGEELGWRGYMYSIIRRRFSLVWTSIIIGVIWGFWHAPLILSGYNYVMITPGCQSSPGGMYSMVAFTIYSISASILLTGIRETTGSVYSAAVGHGVINGVAPKISVLVNGDPVLALPAGLSASIGLLVAALVWEWWFSVGQED